MSAFDDLGIHLTHYTFNLLWFALMNVILSISPKEQASINIMHLFNAYFKFKLNTKVLSLPLGSVAFPSSNFIYSDSIFSTIPPRNKCDPS